MGGMLPESQVLVDAISPAEEALTHAWLMSNINGGYTAAGFRVCLRQHLSGTALAACHAADLVQSLEHHEHCSFKSLSWHCLQAPRCSITVYCSKDPALPDRNTLSLLKA